MQDAQAAHHLAVEHIAQLQMRIHVTHGVDLCKHLIIVVPLKSY